MECIYEVIDQTDDEMYYPIGMFLSAEEAEAKVRMHDEDNTPVSDSGACGEYETIVIRERKIGWEDGGTVLKVFERECRTNEDDECCWSVTYVNGEREIGGEGK